MKKFILVLMMLFMLTGCMSLQKMDLDSVINKSINSKLSLANEYRSGYKYYLPKGLKICDKADYNEKIKSGNYTYYLYVDVVSYYNKVIDKFNVKDNLYYSKPINNKDKFGYLEIKNIKDNKYLIEIMYNYAKIEVIVREEDINIAVANAINVLSSIEYNDTMLANLVGGDTASFNELEYNIFKTTNDSIYLDVIKDDIYEEVKDDVHDTDLVN